MCEKKIFAQKMFIFAQFLEKFAQKQNVPKFLKNLPSFQKLPNTCSPAIVNGFHAKSHTPPGPVYHEFLHCEPPNRN